MNDNGCTCEKIQKTTKTIANSHDQPKNKPRILVKIIRSTFCLDEKS